MVIIKSISFSVYIGEGVFAKLTNFLKTTNYSSCFILCDENTLKQCLPILVQAVPELGQSHIIEIESGEASKALDICAMIWQTLLENDADKNTLVLNLGGGVVSDLGGFCASVYKRGIDYINVPTSLLAMADASVGGKTGIDFSGIKNILGTFAQAKAVFVYPRFLESLPQREYLNGLAEVFKMALISDAKFWKTLQGSIIENQTELLIQKSIRLKNQVVLKDPYDSSIRQSLNFGHSLGHAIEALMLETKNPCLHGEAIVIGMILESHIAWQKKLILKKTLSEIVFCLQQTFKPKALLKVRLQDILERLKQDKKNKSGHFVFSLINGLGSCTIKQGVSETQVKKSLEFYKSLNHA